MIGVEACYGFGDGVFLAPLLKRISEHHNQPVEVAVQAQCADAYHNLPWVGKITHIGQLHEGMRFFGDRICYQVTPNVHFPNFKESNQDHSLIDTARDIGRHYGLGDFDQRPIFIPTPDEMISFPSSRSLIAIESHHKSGQSWARPESFQPVLDRYCQTHEVLWLCNQDAPKRPHVHAVGNRYTRRQLVCLLSQCETFFSVGSGFFCASLALATPPSRVVSLWIDDYYKYERRLTELAWHPNLVWAHNQDELRAAL